MNGDNCGAVFGDCDRDLSSPQGLVPGAEAEGVGGYVPQIECPIGSRHSGEAVGADQDVGLHPGVPDVALQADQTGTILRGPYALPKDRQGQVEEGLGAQVGVNRVKDRVAVANLQASPW